MTVKELNESLLTLYLKYNDFLIALSKLPREQMLKGVEELKPFKKALDNIIKGIQDHDEELIENSLLDITMFFNYYK